MTKVRNDLARRALAGERSAALQLLRLMRDFLERRTGDSPPETSPDWSAAPFEYLREALSQILEGIDPETALGLKHGDAGRRIPDPVLREFRDTWIVSEVNTRLASGQTKTGACKQIAAAQDFPDLDAGYVFAVIDGKLASVPLQDTPSKRLSWTTIRDIYNLRTKATR